MSQHDDKRPGDFFDTVKCVVLYGYEDTILNLMRPAMQSGKVLNGVAMLEITALIRDANNRAKAMILANGTICGTDESRVRGIISELENHVQRCISIIARVANNGGLVTPSIAENLGRARSSHNTEFARFLELVKGTMVTPDKKLNKRIQMVKTATELHEVFNTMSKDVLRRDTPAERARVARIIKFTAEESGMDSEAINAELNKIKPSGKSEGK